MNEAEAFKRQAASDLEVLELLLRQPVKDVSDCHRLHYLQMAAEKASKAAVKALGGDLPKEGRTHDVVRAFLSALKRPWIGEALGWEDFRRFRGQLKALRPTLYAVTRLQQSSPGPKVEYPWEGPTAGGSVDWHVPAEYSFPIDPRSKMFERLVGFLRLMLDRLDVLAQRGSA